MADVPKVSLIDLVSCLSEASDLISPLVVNHQKRVAHIATMLGAELGLSAEARHTLALAGALHDIGVFSLAERFETLQFDYVEGLVPHAVIGHTLLKDFAPLTPAAELILYHHFPWSWRDKAPQASIATLRLANIIYLADRIDILTDHRGEVLSRVADVTATIIEASGRLFAPDAVAAFRQLAEKESFWFDLAAPKLDHILSNGMATIAFDLEGKHLDELGTLFSRIIDFRSRYTALHSCGVANCASHLAKKAGMDEQQCRMMALAGCLHDVGKLAIPREIIEKPSKLTTEEFARIKRHTYYSYHLLQPIPGFATINEWISYHHERPSGHGYPFHIHDEKLPLGARIVAVADVFSAITEERPYRPAMDADQVRRILTDMTDDCALDRKVVGLLLDDQHDMNLRNNQKKQSAQASYQAFTYSVRRYFPQSTELNRMTHQRAYLPG